MALRARTLLKPQVLLPLLLATALLLFASSLGDIRQVGERITHVSLGTLALSLAAAILYLACKAVQLTLLLRRLGFRIARRPFWLAFAVGELAVTLPLGVFAQNWILAAAHQTDIARSSAATVMMVIAEIFVTFLFLAVVGIAQWPELRPASVAVVALMLAGLLTLPALAQHAKRFVAHLRHRWVRRSATGGITLLRGVQELTTPVLLSVVLLIATGYLGAISVAFWLTGSDIVIGHLGYLDATAIYAFALAIILIGVGLFSQIGTTEVLGMLAAHTAGIDYTTGLALMLGFRIVWTGCIWLVCLPVAIVTWHAVPVQVTSSSVERSEKISH